MLQRRLLPTNNKMSPIFRPHQLCNRMLHGGTRNVTHLFATRTKHFCEDFVEISGENNNHVQNRMYKSHIVSNASCIPTHPTSKFVFFLVAVSNFVPRRAD